MNDKSDFWGRLLELLAKVANDVLTSADEMNSSIIAAAALGGLCLFVYKVVSYYKEKFNHEIISKEHLLVVILILITLIVLPVLGVAFAGMYGITNIIAAWQIGLTTPLLIESAYLASAEKSRKGKYHKAFTPDDPDA